MLAVDAVERRQQQKQQHEDPLVARDNAPRHEIDGEQREPRIDRRQQIDRPVDRRRQQEPDRRDERAERRCSVIARRRMQRSGIGIEELRRRPDRGVGNELKARQRRNEYEDQKPCRAPARLVVEPRAQHLADRPVFRLQICEDIHGSDRSCAASRSSITPAVCRASGRRNGRTDSGCRAGPGRPRGDIAPRTPAGP